MQRDITIALAVMPSPLGQVEQNIAAVDTLAGRAARQGAQIVCFAEMCITGYAPDGSIRAHAQEIDGQAAGALGEIARRHNILVMAGLAEKLDDRVFATHLLLCPDGTFGIYRKLHISPPEAAVFAKGDRLALFGNSGCNFGVGLCYDAHFPELAGALADSGADFLLFPHASPHGTPQGKKESWMRHLAARAFDNAVFVGAVNQSGQNGQGLSFPGLALFIGPDGKILAEKSDEGLLVHTLKKEQLDAVRFHRMRYFRPQKRGDIFGSALPAFTALQNFPK
ncbi:MAG: nitrilase-related carbon-nitrogen hydrolase [Desulfatibacillaceae bacterium]|nr:nitrilase-related carbon-nitrogen hydrolase [Desulfatibacillaceae bacterium]